MLVKQTLYQLSRLHSPLLHSQTLHTRAHTHTHMCTVWEHMWKPEVISKANNTGCLDHLPSDLIDSPGLAGQWAPETCLLLPTAPPQASVTGTYYNTHMVFICVPKDPNSGPRVHSAGTLTTEPKSWPPPLHSEIIHLLFKTFFWEFHAVFPSFLDLSSPSKSFYIPHYLLSPLSFHLELLLLHIQREREKTSTVPI